MNIHIYTYRLPAGRLLGRPAGRPERWLPACPQAAHPIGVHEAAGPQRRHVPTAARLPGEPPGRRAIIRSEGHPAHARGARAGNMI